MKRTKVCKFLFFNSYNIYIKKCINTYAHILDGQLLN